MQAIQRLVTLQKVDVWFLSWYRREPLMANYTIGVLFLIPVLLLVASVDERTLNGISIWTKPLKFNVAIVLYLGTLVWYCGWIDQRFKDHVVYQIYLHVLCGTLLFMLPWLYGAAVLGEPAHYNRTHPVLAPMYAIMGVVSVVFTTGTIVVGVLIALNKQSSLTPFLRHSIAWSLYISFVFTVYMAGELASLDSHWIGGSQTDEHGLWGVGWSRDGGDLRVAHFFSLHAMHIIPLIAILTARTAAVRRPGQSAAIICTAYCALLFFIYIQAKNGQAFLPWLG